MKHIILIAALLSSSIISYTAHAKVTIEDAYESESEYYDSVEDNRNEYEKDLYSGLKERQDGNSGAVVEFSTGAETTSIITKTLKPTNSWVCSLSKVSGYYHRGLKGTTAEVYQSGGYWRLKSGRSSCGGCAVSAKAICWKIE